MHKFKRHKKYVEINSYTKLYEAHIYIYISEQKHGCDSKGEAKRQSSRNVETKITKAHTRTKTIKNNNGATNNQHTQTKGKSKQQAHKHKTNTKQQTNKQKPNK